MAEPTPEEQFNVYMNKGLHELMSNETKSTCPKCNTRLRSYSDLYVEYSYCPKCFDVAYFEDGSEVKIR